MSVWRPIAAGALLGVAVVVGEAGELDRSGLALAYPVDDIQIDGDLSDWPQSLPWYSLPFRLLGPPIDPADCSARFRVGYNEEEDTLYVAVEVHDEERSPSEPLPLAFWPDDLAPVLVGIETSPHQRQSLGFLQGEFRANTVTVRGDVNWLEIPSVHFVSSVLTHEQQAYLDAGFDAFLPKPFQLEEVCACLEGLLHVTFDYEPTARSSLNARAAVTPDGLVLPVDLLRPLVEAARRHSATQLERSLAALEPRSDLERRAAEHLRQDLYFRLARFVLTVAPLRERREDIPLLAEHFLGELSAEMGMSLPRFSAAVGE